MRNNHNNFQTVVTRYAKLNKSKAFDKMFQNVAHLHLTAKQRHPNSVKRYIGNLNAVRWLWDKLHKELQTNHINQDPNATAFRSTALPANEKKNPRRE